MIVIEVPGPSCPQGSARAFVVNGRAVITSANKNLSQWRSHAILCIRAEMEAQGLSGPLTGPLGLAVKDYRVRPKSRHKTATWADRRPDLDKILRAAGDAVEAAGLCKSDGQFCWVAAEKSYAERARIVIRVWVLEDDWEMK